MKHMKSLVYLYNIGCISLRSMPAGMGQLTYLRRLELFIVGKNEGRLIGELERLNYLGGGLSISDLGNVKDLTDAKSADLMGKTILQSLTLSWHGNGNYLSGNPLSRAEVSKSSVIHENAEKVLDGLQPHSNLKELKIIGYQGSKFSSWMMNLELPNLVSVSLERCGNCVQLPPLGKLQFLKHLQLRGMDVVKCIDSDLYGDGENPFPSLETLNLTDMEMLEQWATVGGCRSLPCLRELTVAECPMLIEIPIIPSVKKLEIRGCNATVVRSVRNLTSLTFLRIESIPNLMLLPDGLLQNHSVLEHLEISNLRDLQSLSNQILDNLSALKNLGIEDCSELECLPESIQYLTSLQFFNISSCKGLSCLPDQIGFLTSLCGLSIRNCPNLMSLPDGVRSLNMLSHLIIGGCPDLRRRCAKVRGEDWPKIAHIPNIFISGTLIQSLEA